MSFYQPALTSRRTRCNSTNPNKDPQITYICTSQNTHFCRSFRSILLFIRQIIIGHFNVNQVLCASKNKFQRQKRNFIRARAFTRSALWSRFKSHIIHDDRSIFWHFDVSHLDTTHWSRSSVLSLSSWPSVYAFHHSLMSKISLSNSWESQIDTEIFFCGRLIENEL